MLRASGETFCHIGAVGTGHKINLINNCAAIGQMALIAEALTACAKLGVDPKKYFALVSSGAANSGIFQIMAGGGGGGGFWGVEIRVAHALHEGRDLKPMCPGFPCVR